MSNLRDISKREWTSVQGNTGEVNCGSLQRIADAVEKVAQNYQALMTDRDYYKRRTEEEINARHRLQRSYSALRANYTRLKAKSKNS